VTIPGRGRSLSNARHRPTRRASSTSRRARIASAHLRLDVRRRPRRRTALETTTSPLLRRRSPTVGVSASAVSGRAEAVGDATTPDPAPRLRRPRGFLRPRSCCTESGPYHKRKARARRPSCPRSLGSTVGIGATQRPTALVLYPVRPEPRVPAVPPASQALRPGARDALHLPGSCRDMSPTLEGDFHRKDDRRGDVAPHWSGTSSAAARR